ncbi:MAG: major capsid protein [Microviridae sp.]|nr:MAG: major capsid protein [Microviridae sp.]
MQKTLGGDRLGAGNKMKVNLHGYERSTHDLGYIWRSTMAAGTLVPFMTEIALAGDTFDINLDADCKTHPTIGPLFGSYKMQLDVFLTPIRLYHGQLQNNKIGIGMNMASIKLPLMELFVNPEAGTINDDPDNAQINPSCLLSYLDIRGIGSIASTETTLVGRYFNAIPLLIYWDKYKNYYANKQEEIGVMIYTEPVPIVQTIDDIIISGNTLPSVVPISTPAEITINYTGAVPTADDIIFIDANGNRLYGAVTITRVGGIAGAEYYEWRHSSTGDVTILNWEYREVGTGTIGAPVLETFPLSTIDSIREYILYHTLSTSPFIINYDFPATNSPYRKLLDWVGDLSPYVYTQQGLGIKTYNSDLFNNWMSTEWITGTGGINEITAIDTSGGSINIDTIILSKKVYNMLTRIAVSGGTYDDWTETVYDHIAYRKASTPMYMGGLIKELVFQEVVSNAENGNPANPSQPLGTLAGRGVLSKKHKGGKVVINVDEASYITAIVSLTPRLDYSQGNKWHTHLLTMDDLHKPALDEIGFQELIMEQMGWWTTHKPDGGVWTTKSAGQQPAWLNYMTNVNQTRGNFAIRTNEMFMTLNRRYTQDGSDIVDMTTYIDPTKFNFIFAQTSIDAQNFWVQIAVDITARRKMSAKLMPNL